MSSIDFPGSGGGGGGGDISNLSEGAIPSLSSDLLSFEDSGAFLLSSGEIEFDPTIIVPSSSIDVGETLRISEGGSDLVVGNLLKDMMALSVNSDFVDSSGSSDPSFFDFAGPTTLNVQTTDTTVITANPLTFDITGTVTPPDVRLVDRATFRANGAMTNFRAKITDNATGLVLRYIPNKAAFEGREPGISIVAGDTTFFFASNAADTATEFHLGFVPFVIENGQQIDFEVIADAIDVLGDATDFPYLVLEAHDGPPLNMAVLNESLSTGSVPFADTDGHFIGDNINFNFDDSTNTLNVFNLDVSGTLTTISTEDLVISASHIFTNFGYLTTSAKDGGLAVNYLPTSTTATVTAGAFVAGIAATSNPTVGTVEASTLSQGDIVEISQSTDNDGTYEVESHAANVLTIRGIGTVPTVETFTSNQFTANASDSAVVTKVNVSLIQAGTDGDWEIGKGNATPLVFSKIEGQTAFTEGSVPFANSSGDLIEDNTNLFWDDSGNRLGIGTNTPSHTLEIDGGVGDGTLAIRSASGGSSKLLLEDENGVDKLDIAYVDSSPACNITANDTRLVMQTNAGRINITSVGGDLILNTLTTLSEDAQTLSMESDSATSSVAFNLLDSSSVQKLTMEYNENSDITTFESEVNIEIRATDGAIDLSAEGTNDDVNIDSADGGIQITSGNGSVVMNNTITADVTGQIFDVESAGSSDVKYTLSNSGGVSKLELEYQSVPNTSHLNAFENFTISAEGTMAIDSTSTMSIGSVGGMTLTDTTGNIDFDAGVDLTFTSVAQTTILDSSVIGGLNAGLVIEQASTGDAVLHFELTGVQNWTMGIDNDLADQFAIRPATTLGATAPLQILITGEVGINKTPRANHCLDIDTSTSTVVALYDQKDLTIEQGNSANNNSLDMFFNRGDVGFNQSEFWMYNENDNVAADRFFSMNYTDAGAVGGLKVHYDGHVSIGAGFFTSADAHTINLQAEPGGNAQLRLKNDAGTDMLFLDYEDSPNFVIMQTTAACGSFLIDSLGGDLILGASGTGDQVRIDSSDANVTIDSNVGSTEISSELFLQVERIGAGDTDADAFIRKINTLATNGVSIDGFQGDRDPNGNITGAGGDVYDRADGAESGSYENYAATTDTVWFRRRVNNGNSIDIHTQAQYDALVSASSINISSDTYIYLTTDITTGANMVVTNDAELIIESPFRNEITYSGTGIFLDITEASFTNRNCDFAASSTGTFIVMTGGGSHQFQWTVGSVSNFDFLGSISRAVGFPNQGPRVLANFLQINFWGDTLTFEHCGSIAFDLIAARNSVSTNSPLFDVINDFDRSISFRDLRGAMESGESYVRIDPSTFATTSVTVTESNFDGDLFDLTAPGGAGAYTAVADASFAVTAVTSVTDNAGNAVFNTGGLVPTVGQTVVHTTFSTGAYNGTFRCTGTGPGVYSLEDNSGQQIAFLGDDTGSGTGDGITVTTSAAHGLSDGDTLTLDSDLSVEYDGGYVIYNASGSVFDVNAVFGATQTGDWNTAGLDQHDIRVLSVGNPGQQASSYIATAFVNANITANGAITNGVFTDVVFGTAGTALVEGTTAERWKLIDELNGTFEYTGLEPFDGYITFDFTTESSGGTQPFRFKIQHDVGAGFVDLPDNVEAETQVGSDSKSLSKTFPLAAATGDQIKPLVTRDSGTSGITTTYATIYATQ